eukprot:TRINITY_DN47227_c0_g1_i1.p1 TRINITY_DN47227_c0_g1~~TRINITY_DN47227_c0_g1_i1.p1  ORF type:complete len:500 (+),score=90.52 TRINITY_DN47227_c0_g1_i1:70-1569(+)
MASVGHKLGLYDACCEAYSVAPRAEVISSLKTNSDTITFGHAAGRCSPGQWLALVELLLSFEAPTDSNAAFVRDVEVKPFYRGTMSRAATPIRKLHLNAHRVAGENEGVLLARLIRCSTTLTEIQADRNSVGEHAATAIGSALRGNTVLTKVSLCGNSCGQRGALAIAEALTASQSTTNLTVLNMENVSAGLEGVRALEAAADAINQHRAARDEPPIEVLTAQNFHAEEIANAVTHGIPALVSIFGGILMLGKVWDRSERHIIGALAFCGSLTLCFLSSTLYHSFYTMKFTHLLFRIFDHCAIYFLIAGTFTPIVLLNFHDWAGGPWLLAFQWVTTAVGVIHNCFNADGDIAAPVAKTEVALYLLMGWSAVAMLPRLFQESWELQRLIVAGGMFYTVGVVFFVREHAWPMWHAVWHVFAAAGAFCHFLAVYYYACEVELPFEEHGLAHKAFTQLVEAQRQALESMDVSGLAGGMPVDMESMKTLVHQLTMEFWNKTRGL